jgi:hypothetical protein
VDRLCELATGLGRERDAVFQDRGVLTAEERADYVRALREADRALMAVAGVLYGVKLRKAWEEEHGTKGPGVSG